MFMFIFNSCFYQSTFIANLFFFNRAMLHSKEKHEANKKKRHKKAEISGSEREAWWLTTKASRRTATRRQARRLWPLCRVFGRCSRCARGRGRTRFRRIAATRRAKTDARRTWSCDGMPHPPARPSEALDPRRRHWNWRRIHCYPSRGHVRSMKRLIRASRWSINLFKTCAWNIKREGFVCCLFCFSHSSQLEN